MTTTTSHFTGNENRNKIKQLTLSRKFLRIFLAVILLFSGVDVTTPLAYATDAQNDEGFQDSAQSTSAFSASAGEDLSALFASDSGESSASIKTDDTESIAPASREARELALNGEAAEATNDALSDEAAGVTKVGFSDEDSSASLQTPAYTAKSGEVQRALLGSETDGVWAIVIDPATANGATATQSAADGATESQAAATQFAANGAITSEAAASQSGDPYLLFEPVAGPDSTGTISRTADPYTGMNDAYNSMFPEYQMYSHKPEITDYRTKIKSIKSTGTIKCSGTIAHLFDSFYVLEDISALSTWDTSAASNLSYLFHECYDLTNISALKNWNISSIWNLESMFSCCINLSDFSSIKNWDTSNVNYIDNLFYRTSLSDLSPISNWNISNIYEMCGVFSMCTDLSDLRPISNWQVRGDLSSMFSYCTNLSDLTPISNWNVGNVNSTVAMFKGCSGITSLVPLANWNICGSMGVGKMFSGCSGLTNLEGLSTHGSCWEMSKVYSMESMFQYCKNLTDISAIANWSVKTAQMQYMFQGCTSLTDITPIGNWSFYGSTSHINSSLMDIFSGCENLEKMDLAFLDGYDSEYAAEYITGQDKYDTASPNVLEFKLPNNPKKFLNSSETYSQNCFDVSYIKSEFSWVYSTDIVKSTFWYEYTDDSGKTQQIKEDTEANSYKKLMELWDAGILLGKTIKIVGQHPVYVFDTTCTSPVVSGNVMEGDTLESLVAQANLPTPKEGYSYKWYLDKKKKYRVNISKAVKRQNVDTFGYSLYPQEEELETYKVKFVDWDGKVLSEQDVLEGTAATPPANPSRKGYNFVGWDTDITKITEDTTVTAQYESIVTRLWGEVAIETAISVVDKAYEGVDAPTAAVLACNSSFYDSMSASGLAGALNAPILLTHTDFLADATKAELEKLNIKAVYIAGGTASISQAVEDTLKGMGITVKREAGIDAADTSLLCAKEVATLKGSSVSSEIIVATPDTFQDAISMGGYAYKNATPILLQQGGATAADRTFSAGQKALLTGSGAFANAKVLTAGGTAAVSDESFAGVRDTGDRSKFKRFAGDDAYDTSTLIAKELFPNATQSIIATGAGDGMGLDALAGGVLAGHIDGGAPTLLVQPKGDNPNYKTLDNYLKSRASSVTSAYILGGSAAMPTGTGSVTERICNIFGQTVLP